MAKDARREQILEAALHAFERGGYHGTHVDDVIREAQIARGTFYVHFDGKHAVFAALVDRMLAVFLEARPPEGLDTVRTASDAAAYLRASYGIVFRTFRRHRRLCRLWLEEAVGVEKGFTARLDAHYRAWHQRVAEVRRAFVRAGAARRDLDVDLTADLVLGMVERLTRRHVLGEAEPDVDRLADAVVAFEMRGIGA
jgi:AcrR family transcriptional regulator